jgi:hypothetical protein
MRKSFLIVLALLAANPAFALDEIIKNYRGIRSLGMGGVVTTTGLYDEALFGNPATQLEDPTWKLSILSLTAEVNSNFISDIQEVRDVQDASGTGVITTIADKGIAGKNEHLRLSLIVPGFYSPHFFGDNTGFAFGLLLNNQTNIMLRSNGDVDTQSLVDVGPSFGLGHKFLDGDLNVGVNVHVIYRLAADKSLKATSFLTGSKLSLSSIGGQGIGVDADLGGYYKLPIELPFFKKLSVGGSLNSLVRSTYRVAGKDLLKSVTGTPPPNDRTVSLGARLDFPELLIFKDTLAAIEVQNIGGTTHLSSFWKKFHLGAETKLLGFLSVRGGFNQGYAAGGVGFDLPLLKIDVATYGEEIGPVAGSLEDRRYALRLSFDI